ncbi:glycosyltransferase family 2 protein [Flavobacteriaceae bacterium S0825]|uniref:glycosyltransferase family 2 protein n=1 Tax=Gaetbulibacter sp. S0825 TaxID=2720084 RepID=UPI00142FBB16|nr:glycosyltransferase family A protein [Gaetbulibacter sp. S0825]MCK0109025.1 glycosyltransferase family 2 protein [Flavobacteriaceae bacterium S0825]NIX64660.1 glycosyltransferase family 2 protein [Gaetbulibacter sp. S0825]
MSINVSIIVPCYNQAQYLDECLNSVFDQVYSNWECIIVNDGSTDNTEAVAKKWQDKDNRIKYLSKKNGGLSAARNSGISIAKGQFILPLDSDDKISNNYIAQAVNTFEEDSTLKLVYCNAEKFGDESGLWNLPPFSLYNLSQNNLIFPCAMYKKKDWEIIGGYDVNMIYGWEDWEFWISLLKNGGGVKKLDLVGFYYRIKAVSMLKNIDEEKGIFLLNYLSVKHADFFVKHYGSFKFLAQETERIKNSYEEKLKSEKFVINAFLKKFFGFTIFKKSK